MKILLLSDLHTEFQKNSFEVPITDADCIILAGDIGIGVNNIILANKWQRELNIPIIIINGNHEYYHNNDHYHDARKLNLNLLETMQLKQFALCGQDVHFLENRSVIIDGVRFLGCTLWTNFRTNTPMGTSKSLTRVQEMKETQRFLSDYRVSYLDWHYQGSLLLTPEYVLKMHEKSRRWLNAELKKDFNGKTVVITHHAPSLECIAPRFRGDKNGGFCNKMEGFLKRHNEAIDLYCFGHTHFNIDATIEGVRVVSNQCGYPNERVEGFDALKIINI